jgi:hypothetical protein
MPIINDRTTHYNLALPNQNNTLKDDAARLREALTSVDSTLHAQAQAMPLKADLVDGKVPSAQLPSFVDDVLEVANFAALPVTGEAGKIYVTLNDNAQYRWGGSAYVEIVGSPGSTDEVTEGSTNLYFTPARAQAAVGALFSDEIVTPGSEGQTLFTITGGYTVGKIDVYLNGTMLFGDGDDFTASSGTSVVLTTGAATTDKLRFRRWLY